VVVVAEFVLVVFAVWFAVSIGFAALATLRPVESAPAPSSPAADEPLVDRIAQLDLRIREAYERGDRDEMDRLIDLRNAIRPARVAASARVPVVPGRSS
jgi:hypothetical protein